MSELKDNNYKNVEGADVQYMILEYINYAFGLWDYSASHLIADNIKILEMKQLTYNDGKSRNILISYLLTDAKEPSVAIYKMVKSNDEKKKAWIKAGSLHIGPTTAYECDNMLKNATVLFGAPKNE